MLLLYGQVDLRAKESFYQLLKFFSRFYLTEKFCLRFNSSALGRLRLERQKNLPTSWVKKLVPKKKVLY